MYKVLLYVKLQPHQEGSPTEDVAVPGLRVEQEVPEMHLVLLQVQVSQILIPRDLHFHDAVLGIAVLLSDERLEISEPSAVAVSGKLETDRKPVTGRIGAAVQANPEPDGKGSGVYD